MAKIIRFPLEMKDGTQVRTMGELKEHWDIDKIVAHFLDGKLVTWLRDRHFDNEAVQIEALDKNNAKLRHNLSTIFGMEYEPSERIADDMEALQEKQERINRLRQYTDDKAILDHIDCVAFDTNEIFDVFDVGAETVYLVNGRFEIPLQVKNKKYVGIGETIAVIDSKDHVDFETLGIRFENVKFDEKYRQIHNQKNYLLVKAEEACREGDIGKAIDFFTKASEFGDDTAMLKLGRLYWTIGDSQSALEWWSRAAKIGNTDALHEMGTAYFVDGIGQDLEKAVRLWHKAANAGNVDAMVELSFCYENGTGVEKNSKKALEWLCKGADGGEKHALSKLGFLFFKGNGVEQNKEKAVELWHKAAKAGEENAMFCLSFCYQNGDGVEKNEQKAVEWLRKSADGGDMTALTELGKLYFNGDGVKQNKKKAVELWHKAVDVGNNKSMNPDDAMYHLGYAYFHGEGVGEDEEKGLEWYLEAAERNNIDALKALGDFYRSSDNKKARKWCKKAALLGDGEAAYKLALLSLENKDWSEEDQQTQYEYWNSCAKARGYKDYSATISDNNSDPRKGSNDGSCFITTAVCGSFEKHDNCYELNMFRTFRDSWLCHQSDGASLIAEYYETAPRIVDAIDRLSEAKEVYRFIWDEYLCPCLCHLEKRQYEECKTLYVKMVHDLRKKFSK